MSLLILKPLYETHLRPVQNRSISTLTSRKSYAPNGASRWPRNHGHYTISSTTLVLLQLDDLRLRIMTAGKRIIKIGTTYTTFRRLMIMT